jgi:antitoxin (DNA-binding transcriptional repressor) of toxin-antitoxin stability system
MAYRATNLRKDIYKILDRVLETGEAVEIERRGRRLRIIPADGIPPTKRLRPIPGLVVGDPGELEHIDWTAEWKP